MVEAQENKSRARLTCHLPEGQIKAVKLIAIHEDKNLTRLVGQALDYYIDSHYGEGTATRLRQAATLDDVQAILGDSQISNFLDRDVET